uniref:Uncharacterized protein n=1 Tax=Tanacetum cinerariifolium TaxID=118510 RepID=A0A6L2LHR4_TANCI|nr:hypothetical protein [Tanacetum cinerariifolium]
MGDDVDINTLTIEKYMALIQDKIRPGVVKPEIDDDKKSAISNKIWKRYCIMLEKDMGDDVDINTLTIEKYLALIQDKIRPGVVKPEIDDDVEFEINGKFIRELRHKLFKGTDDEDAHEHELVPHDLLVVQPCVPPMPFPGHLKKQKDNTYKTRKTICMIGSPEKIHNKKSQEDEGDIDDGWDIKIEDVKRIRKNTSIGARDVGFRRGKQAKEDAQG